ncbi:hypothetical protein IQ235_16100 [Oscillatoriales cyanobacterium LEGE 11467]|uniref:Sigma-70 family RNA polymerase sigma factor n=1 Tax=Zarconia navalis LEGE 11467 TaxID=1828826 RepID=A0A928W1K7_9CYAN|nr:hypothetical protein [Zarconia navalis]MBE9042301.1 hypothetical protein [Zarconia navalis LEGE 11467]
MSEAKDKDPIDEQLNQLAREAGGHPPRSYERRKALNRLVEKILASGRLGHPQRSSFPLPSAIYEDLYDEALSATLMEMCQKIEQYDRTKDVMAWCNFLLTKRFIDAWTKYQRGGVGSVPQEKASLFIRPSFEDLDGWQPPQKNISQSEQLKQLIEENPDNMFGKEYVRGQPQATFQFLAMAKIWQDRKWKEISSELNVPSSSLCEFYKKQLHKFKPFFKEYLQV